jgi:hypothetical protein
MKPPKGGKKLAFPAKMTYGILSADCWKSQEKVIREMEKFFKQK